MNKICTKCNIEKDINDFYINRGECKTCRKEYKRKNKDIINKYNQEYRKNNISNKDTIRKYRIDNKDRLNEYSKNKYATDSVYRFSRIISSLLYQSFKHNGYKKNTKTMDMLGITIKDFQIYIESQFEIWMTWENQGKCMSNYNETWQLDHIIPISNAKSIEDVIKLNHYTNLRPLCSKLNLEKSNH
jgi:hypothetical protein